MTNIVPTEMGTVIENHIPIEQSTVNKLSNPENANRIKAHLADIHCEQEIKTDDKCIMHILRTNIYEELSFEKFERKVNHLVKNHEEFLENVNLRMPEVKLIPQKKLDENSDRVEIKDEIEAATRILKDFDEQKLENDDSITMLMPYGIGIISVKFFRDVLTKYLNGNVNI